jgi:hypothetical protein
MIAPKVGTPVLIVRREAHSVQPEAGIIAFMHNDRMVNVAGFNANGAPFNMTSLTLVQDGVAPELGDYTYFASDSAPVRAAPPPPIVAPVEPAMPAVAQPALTPTPWPAHIPPPTPFDAAAEPEPSHPPFGAGGPLGPMPPESPPPEPTHVGP